MAIGYRFSIGQSRRVRCVDKRGDRAIELDVYAVIHGLPDRFPVDTVDCEVDPVLGQPRT